MAIINRILAFFTSLVTLASSFFGVNPTKLVEKVEDFKVTTYVRGDYAQDPKSIYPEDFSIITDIVIFECATFDNKGNVNVEVEKMEKVLNNLHKAIGDRDVAITLNLLGPSGTTDSEVWEEQMEAQSNEHTKAFQSGVLEGNIVEVLGKYDFDGVHFDYEYPLSHKAWRNYNKFLVSLDESLGAKYSLGVSVSDWNLKFSAKAIDVIDSFELMSYDFLDEDGKHATYEGTIALLKKLGLHGIPREKNKYWATILFSSDRFVRLLVRLQRLLW